MAEPTEPTTQPKYTVPEGLELTPEQRSYYEQFGRIPKPVRGPSIKSAKVWKFALSTPRSSLAHFQPHFDSADWSMKKNEKADENTDSNNPNPQPAQPVVKQNPRLGALGMLCLTLCEYVAYLLGGGGGQQKKPMVIKTNISSTPK